ncbi:hypothetical protein ACUNV4_02320 [Granulosicoccus sp. 3-233]|uniref:hypothetical protein n=1 Tax=Granulosicoccus sp. 3-233 TaxID=3417969 RepID=UPI003D34C0FD
MVLIATEKQTWWEIMARSNKAAQFVKRLQDDEEFRFEVGPALLAVPEGDWAGVIDVAEQSGYSFTRKQLLGVIPEGFFKGKGRNPEQGWDKSTLTSGKSKTTR